MDKNTRVVCHSFLQWTMFCQNSPLWPVGLGWSCMAWLIASLSYTRPFTKTRLCSKKGDTRLTNKKKSLFHGKKQARVDASSPSLLKLHTRFCIYIDIISLRLFWSPYWVNYDSVLSLLYTSSRLSNTKPSKTARKVTPPRYLFSQWYLWPF